DVNVVSTRIRQTRRELCTTERARQCEQTSEKPHQEHASGRRECLSNYSYRNEDANADHVAGNQHDRIEQAYLSFELALRHGVYQYRKRGDRQIGFRRDGVRDKISRGNEK